MNIASYTTSYQVDKYEPSKIIEDFKENANFYLSLMRRINT